MEENELQALVSMTQPKSEAIMSDGLERSPGEGKGYPLQYSGLENSVDCLVDGVTKSRTRLSNFHLNISLEMTRTETTKVMNTPQFRQTCVCVGLAKTFIRVFLGAVMEKPERLFRPTQ